MVLRTLLPCLTVLGLLTAAMAQIPNAGFEQWVDQGGYTEPANWLTYNDVLTPQGYFATCDPGTPGATDAYHAMITSRTTPEGSTIQGWMSAGTSATHAGFPYAQRPATLIGQWQYGIQPSDTGEVQIALIGWNGSSGGPEMIAHGSLKVTGNVGAWTTFSVPFTYFSSAAPDTALIQFAASKDFTAPVEGSFMKIDDLAFAGTVGLNDRTASLLFSLHPSPTTSVLRITSGSSIADVTVTDLTGRTVMTRSMNAPRLTLDVAELPAGRYFVRVCGTDHTVGMRSFVKL